MSEAQVEGLWKKQLCHWRYYAWLVWGLGAAFFFSEYFAHVSLGVMLPELMRAFHVGAFSLGSMSAFFWYPYVFMQVPVGALVDRYGPHRLLMVTSALCAASCILFGLAQVLWVAKLSRFLMGLTGSFAFVSTLKLATMWFPASRLGFLAGCTQALGMLGAVVGEGPVAFGVEQVGWRHTMFIMGGAIFLLSLAIGLLMRDFPEEKPGADKGYRVTSFSALWQGFVAVLRNPQSWINGVFVGLLFAPTGTFGELWGPSYLVGVYHLTPSVSATAIGFIFIGWTVGGPLIGKLSDRLQRRRPILATSAFLSLITLLAILYAPYHSTWVLFVLLFLFGVSNTGVGVSYALAGEINAKSIAGMSMAFANMASVIVAAGLQPMVGWLLELQWDHRMYHHAPIYAGHAYKMAMLVLPIGLLGAFLIAFALRETYCKPVKS